MSSIRLKKEHDGHKAGDVISRPWLAANELIAAGVAERPTAPAAVVVPAVVPVAPKVVAPEPPAKKK